MDQEAIRRYCLQKHKACETRPFGDVPICYKLNNRIFAQLYPYADDFKLTLKCTAPVGDFYRQLCPGKIVRGYHCPPVQQPYWNTIYLEDFPDDELLHLIDLAYETVLYSFSKKVQAEILSGMNTVRKAKFEDMAVAAHIMVISFRTAFADFVSQETMDACTSPDNCLCLLESIYREGKMHFLMGGDQGFLCWQETDDCAEIMAIHSLPESWGTGLGHAMLTEALNQIGDRPAYLWAFKENTRARRFYEKHGFHWDGTERVSEFDSALEVRYVRK